MRIILISDSHGNHEGIDKIFKNEKFDYLFFMGDGLDDLKLYSNLDNVYKVSGNCDFFSKEPSELLVNIDKYKFFITHGHRYSVKHSLDDLIKRGKSLCADFVFYGHTHLQKIERYDNIYYINPGSFQNSLNKKPKGLILNINDEITVEQLNI